MIVLADTFFTNHTPSKVLLVVLTLFLVGSVIGYVLEVLFRRFVSVKKWVNPGFMKGPWLPMYGFGLVGMFFLCYGLTMILPSSIPLYNPTGHLFGKEQVMSATIGDLILILLMTIMMITLEFVAGLIFVKGFKVRLWDYTNMKGNILGIICPLFNLIWFAVAVIYYYGINPFVYEAFLSISNYLFGGVEANNAHFGAVFILGLIYGIFTIDLCVSIGLFAKVGKLAKVSGVVERYEKLREEVKKASEDAKKKFFDKLPEAIKKNVISKENKNSFFEKAYEATRNALLIHPEKKGNEENYDENGRPKKEE